MKKYLGVMALGLGLALFGATASWAQVTGGPGGSGGPGNGTAAGPPSGMNNSENGSMNSSERSSMGGGAEQSKKTDVSPGSPGASIRQEK
jgi:hypothetical protein